MNDLQQEKKWIEAAQKDPDAFRHLFDKYHDPVLNFTLRRTCNFQIAQDVTSSTFTKALDKIDKFTWRGISFSSWIFRIAINEINLYYRKNKRYTALTIDHEKHLKSEIKTDTQLIQAEERLARNQQFKKLHEAMSKLKPKYQDALSLRYFEDKSIKEIAEILGRSENTIKTHIRRGLINLRKIL